MIAPPTLKEMIANTIKEIPVMAYFISILFVLVFIGQCVELQARSKQALTKPADTEATAALVQACETFCREGRGGLESNRRTSGESENE